MQWQRLAVWIIFVAMTGTSAARAAGEVEVTVDATRPRQVMEGFGATTHSLVHEGPLGDTLTPELRARTIKAIYGEVKINGGNLDLRFLKDAPPPPASSPHHPELATRPAPPETTSRSAQLWNGYRIFGSEAMKTKVIDLGRPHGFTEFCLAPNTTALD